MTKLANSRIKTLVTAHIMTLHDLKGTDLRIVQRALPAYCQEWGRLQIGHDGDIVCSTGLRRGNEWTARRNNSFVRVRGRPHSTRSL